jgi:hypothetical protein
MRAAQAVCHAAPGGEPDAGGQPAAWEQPALRALVAAGRARRVRERRQLRGRGQGRQRRCCGRLIG